MAELPVGSAVELPGRGTTYVLQAQGPPGAPTVVLIHGLTLTAAVNWFGALGPLATNFRVVALDLRGHGRGIAMRGRFSLEDCADDVAALADELRLDRFIAVGYSMGGLVAQMLWRRHPDYVAGLVLCATSRNFLGSAADRMAALMWSTMGPLVQANPVLHAISAHAVGVSLIGRIEDDVLRRWVEAEMAHMNLATLTAAIDASTRFSSHDWIGGVNVPTAVLVTAEDHVVHPVRQRKLAAAIDHAVIHEVQAGHGFCVSSPVLFGRVLLDACLSVSSRIQADAETVNDESA